MAPLFLNRIDAGRQLAARLHRLAGRAGLIVVGLPRGGVPVAREIALALGAPLDVFIVRKLGVPGYEEVAMGAVATGGVRVINRDVVDSLQVPPAEFERVTARELKELERRERSYRAGRPFPQLTGATVVLVDDGVATGATMLAAAKALKQQGAKTIIAAAPVMALGAQRLLREAADECEYVAAPEPFYGVGTWYRDFTQTTDEEVQQILREAATPQPEKHHAS
jgi:predicted phosphoribosyltransferase